MIRAYVVRIFSVQTVQRALLAAVLWVVAAFALQFLRFQVNDSGVTSLSVTAGASLASFSSVIVAFALCQMEISSREIKLVALLSGSNLRAGLLTCLHMLLAGVAVVSFLTAVFILLQLTINTPPAETVNAALYMLLSSLVLFLIACALTWLTDNLLTAAAIFLLAPLLAFPAISRVYPPARFYFSFDPLRQLISGENQLLSAGTVLSWVVLAAGVSVWRAVALVRK
ncbi:hypothetical protein CCYS_13315 [Corynebacterium cystitidis DSM 20524]|uniref:Uncharacterized protein n=2 Tax=Corynebacterium cystitidis TaxID=35757 RepID=A0A1H9TBT2_9CORY|nr:hypothetical protein CCYS_13315 [Corynebacterium cystitidis DSM 20524]SER94621.1 hypothetical protein SAMN05661109_01403 [Corynebacterium cystitidis DSM 20524]SNV92167.1 Uncharacterised protein [Corynebacterium cystitidis]